MKNKISKILAFSILSLAILLSFSRSVLAESPAQISEEEKISKVQAECLNIKKHLSKLRSTDALKRVNLGRDFESISNDLMEKLNTRIVVNKLNGANLIAETANFSKKFAIFKEKYQAYDKESAKLFSQDCQKNGREFMNELEKVRTLRRELQESVDEVRKSAENYRKELQEFEKGVLNG